jgi:hypothetical protein
MIVRRNRAGVLIRLEPGRLTASMVREGAVVRSVEEHLSAGEWAGHWESGLRSLAEPLDRVLTRVRASSRDRAVVLFESPQATAELMEVPARGAEAISAARLAVSERLGLMADSPCIAVRPMGEVGSSDGGRRTQLLVVACDEVQLGRVSDWLSGSSLGVVSMTPSAGPMLLVTARMLRESAASSEDLRVFIMERHRTVVGTVRDRQIQMLRSFEVGVHHIVEAMVRASGINDVSRSGNIAPDKALEMLKRCGLPHAGSDPNDYGDLEPRSILPLIQPVLQRLYVELKQSFRLGGRQGKASGAVLHMYGEGAQIAGIADAIGESLNVEIDAPTGVAESFGPAALFASEGAAALKLTTSAAQVKAANRRVRSAALVGAGLGLGLVGLQMAATSVKLRQVDEAMARNGSAIEQAQQFRLTSVSAAEHRAKVSTAMDIVEKYGGNQPDWQGCLTELALAAHDRVKLIEIRGGVEDREPVIVVSGLSDASEDGASLTKFIETLTSSPFIRSVDVVSRRLVDVDEAQSHQFRLRVRLIGIDFVHLHEEAAQ